MQLFTGKYTAIIGKTTATRSLNSEERILVQQKVHDCINLVNQLFFDYIAAKFSPLCGDEFEGLLFNSEKTFKIIDYIERQLYPTQLYFGIGIGEIFTELSPAVNENDGPAFHKARDMIHYVNAKNSKTNIMIQTHFVGNTDEILNSILALTAALKSKWTSTEREAIFSIEYNKELDIDKQLKIDKVNITNRLLTSGYYSYKQAMEVVTRILKEQEHIMI